MNLTPHQTKILELMKKGLTSKEIAEKLDSTPKNVSLCKTKMFKRVGFGEILTLVPMRAILTRKEHQVFLLVKQGFKAIEIARKLKRRPEPIYYTVNKLLKYAGMKRSAERRLKPDKV